LSITSSTSLHLARDDALDRYEERKTVLNDDSDDRRALAAMDTADDIAPLVLANVASTNASSKFSSLYACRRARHAV
jgi:hypothetical protein